MCEVLCYPLTMVDVVIALIEKDQKICIGQRRSEPFKGFLECPGGKVENGESLIDALKRELREEGNAMIHQADYITHYIVSNQHGDFRLHWFKVELLNEFDPIIYEEIKWVNVDDLNHLNWIEHNRPYIPMMKKAISLKSTDLFLKESTTEEELVKILQDDNVLIKNIHLKQDGHLIESKTIDLYSIKLV